MTDHEHHPPVSRDHVRSLIGGKIVITLDGRETVKTWDEAWAFAQKLIYALEVVRP